MSFFLIVIFIHYRLMPFERDTQLCMLDCCLQDNIQLFPKYDNENNKIDNRINRRFWRSKKLDVDDQDDHCQAGKAENSPTKSAANPSQIAAYQRENLFNFCSLV